jgi:tetratricopeptide (TPR) repeat protein
MKHRVRALLAACLLALGAAPAAADFEYRPSDDAAGRLGAAEARRLLEAALQPNANSIACFAARGNKLIRVSGVFGSIHFELRPLDASDGPALWFVYERAPRPRLRYVSAGAVDRLRIDLGPARGAKDPVALACNIDGAPWDGAAARQLADALRRLQIESGLAGGAAAAAVFGEAAKRYRGAAPELPEEVRRLRLQAEAALHDKRFEDAAERYAQALQIAPWWPEGRFNLAIVLADLGAYRSAEREMKRYLVLSPGDPDAPQLQDKLREWDKRAAGN